MSTNILHFYATFRVGMSSLFDGWFSTLIHTHHSSLIFAFLFFFSGQAYLQLHGIFLWITQTEIILRHTSDGFGVIDTTEVNPWIPFSFMIWPEFLISRWQQPFPCVQRRKEQLSYPQCSTQVRSLTQFFSVVFSHAPSTVRPTVSFYLRSSGSNTRGEVEGT